MVLQNANRFTLPLLHKTVLLNWYYRAMGAKIGKDVVFHVSGLTPMMHGYDLITIEDDACVDKFAGISSIIYTAAEDAAARDSSSGTSPAISNKSYDGELATGSSSSCAKTFPYGTMTLKRTYLGKGSVLGARGVLSCGVRIPGGTLIHPCSGAGNPEPSAIDTHGENPNEPVALRAPGSGKPLPAGPAVCVVLLSSLYASLAVHIPALGKLSDVPPEAHKADRAKVGQ
jgi:acetyltransferase-like isoleucine patch superfamily enzyme